METAIKKSPRKCGVVDMPSGPFVKCDSRCASKSARGSQGSRRQQEPQQQQLESKHWPKAGAQEGPASTV